MGQKFNVFLGCAWVAIVTPSVMKVIPQTDSYKYSAAITECELELPRNQKCEIYARPVEVK